jgi:hypothetical protein
MDRPRQSPPPVSRLRWRLFKVVSVVAIFLAPIAALSLWLLMSDPVTAAGVMERGDLMPVAYALARMIGKAISAALSFM